MRQRIARGAGWIAVLFALAWFFAACTQGGMDMVNAAYPLAGSSYTQAGEPTPGEDGRDDHGAASRGGMTPAQSLFSTQEEESLLSLPALEPKLPSRQLAVCHALRSMMFKRPLSELASRTGGHAPPL